MNKEACAASLAKWVFALFLQVGGLFVSASFSEDVKKLRGEDLDSLAAEQPWRKDDWTREELRKLTEVDSSFRNCFTIWSRLFLTAGWSIIDYMSLKSELAGPVPSEMRVLLEIVAANPYACILWQRIPKKWHQLRWTDMLEALGPFLVAGGWYILSCCNALWGWTYFLLSEDIFVYGYLLIITSFVAVELFAACYATLRLRRIQFFLAVNNNSETRFPTQLLFCPLLSIIQDFSSVALLTSVFATSARLYPLDKHICGSTCYLLIHLAIPSWEDLVRRRARSVVTAGGTEKDAQKMEEGDLGGRVVPASGIPCENVSS